MTRFASMKFWRDCASDVILTVTENQRFASRATPRDAGCFWRQKAKGMLNISDG